MGTTQSMEDKQQKQQPSLIQKQQQQRRMAGNSSTTQQQQQYQHAQQQQQNQEQNRGQSSTFPRSSYTFLPGHPTATAVVRLSNQLLWQTVSAATWKNDVSTTLCEEQAPPPPPPLLSPPPPPLPASSQQQQKQQQQRKNSNVSSSSSPPPPPPPVAGTTATKAATADPSKDGADGDEANDSIAKMAAAVSSYTNPGPYEQAAMDCKRLVSLDTYDGFRCDINKQVSPFMAVVHNFWLGTNMIPDGRKSTYAFVTQVADEQGLLMSRVDMGRQGFDGRIQRAVLGGLAMLKIQMGVSVDGTADQFLSELDFGGQTWTGNLKYGSMGGDMVYGCNFFQAITPSFHMGGEGMFIAANRVLLSNYTAKYTIPAKTGEEDANIAISQVVAPTPAPRGAVAEAPAGSSTFIVNYNTGQQAASLNYKRVVTPNRVTLGAELQFSPVSLESQFLLGAEFKLTRSKLQFCIDGGGRIQSLVEAKLGMAPGSPTINFSADVDHFKEELRFGYGINIDG